MGYTSCKGGEVNQPADTANMVAKSTTTVSVRAVFSIDVHVGSNLGSLCFGSVGGDSRGRCGGTAFCYAAKHD